MAIRLGLFYGCAGTDRALLKFNAQALTVYGLFVAIPGEALDTHGSDVSAEATKALQKGHLNAASRRRNGSREPSGSRANNEHVGLMDYRNGSSGFLDVHNASYGSLFPADCGRSRP